MIYIYCPKNTVTGGPDALHQLHYYMNKLGIENKLAYIDSLGKIDYNAETPVRYIKYCDDNSVLREKIEVDKLNNTIILPEIYNDFSFKITNAKVIIWWLSVLNWTKSSSLHNITLKKKILRKLRDLLFLRKRMDKINNFNIDKFIRKDVTHWGASFFALDFLKTIGIEKCIKMIEPISLDYLNNQELQHFERKDSILYNPTRAKKTMKKIIKKNKDLNFIPIQGYSIDELINLYNTHKLYIDLGEFPGAERIPKEAVYNNMVLITGRGGASNFYQDVPISDFYKIGDKDDMLLIRLKIDYMIRNYKNILCDFKDYRDTVSKLEINFKKQLKDFFENE